MNSAYQHNNNVRYDEGASDAKYCANACASDYIVQQD